MKRFGEFELITKYETKENRNGIKYQVSVFDFDQMGTAFLFDNNNAAGEWYLIKIGSLNEMIYSAKKLSEEA